MREAVGLFHDMEQLQLAVKELERTEFPRDALSVLGTNQEAIEARFGNIDIEKLENAPIDKDAPVLSEEKTIGSGVMIAGSVYIGAMAAALAAGAITIPAIITAAIIGGAGGGAVGAVLAKILGNNYDADIEEQLKKGGLLLWVRTSGGENENKACEILRRYGADHVHVHEL
ncbi:MAG: hypothetical protein DI586_06360 [Micavibrio aeruginosavorus]|uniref:DUF1269 domain-containing protein n=1 Tax=Micavibrio aeruginosavorus TaxID=349221 RepID=A0A2W5FMK1_9BACT|nr:MAG: hypothetical protein DI586_06360 [Micavibrio aeruginosavorus]